MDAILQFLIDWGYWGLFLGSFIAGSVLPFSSEAVLAACVGPLGLDPVISIAAATAGNVAGGMTCYWMGRSGQYGMESRNISCKKREGLGPWTEAGLYHGTGAWMVFLSSLSLFWEVHIHCIRHDACQYMDCHSRYDHRKILRYALLVWGGIGSLRFNALKL